LVETRWVSFFSGAVWRADGDWVMLLGACAKRRVLVQEGRRVNFLGESMLRFIIADRSCTR
jgi:hypothetical protein